MIEFIEIKKLFNIEKGSLQSTKCTEGLYDFITASSEWKTHNEFTHNQEALIVAVSASGSLGRVHYVKGKFISSDLCFILSPKSEEHPVDLSFYYYIFKSIRDDLVKSTATGTSKLAINKTNFGNYKLPYVEIEMQRRFKEKLINVTERKEKLSIIGDEQLNLIQNLRQLILQEESNGLIKLEKHLAQISDRINEDAPNLRMIGVSNEDGVTELTTNKKDGFHKYKIVTKNSFLYNPMRVNVGSIAYYEGEEDCITSPDYVVFKIKSEYPAKALLFYLKSHIGLQEIAENVQGSVRQRLYFDNLCDVKVPNINQADYRIVDLLFEKIDRINELFIQNNNTLAKLNQIVLKEMFEK